MSKNNKYKLKQMFSQLSKADHDLAMKIAPKELGISERTFFRDLTGEGDDIPHYRFLKYCKLLGVEEKALEDFDREEIEVRPLKDLKDQQEQEELLQTIGFKKPE